ncbi:COG1361 family protein [Halorussus halobius]|uniref:hypothetical protein n=1 Tax=Halorussus halobius TaxID=1710537 RepID=UPI00109264F3|nr:hypothetical protein [Halorussus halobius]
MTRNPVPPLLVALVVAATVAPAGAGVAVADDDFVSVAVDAPAFPTPEQPFRIGTTVKNAEVSDTRYDVRRLELRSGEASGSELHSERRLGPTTVDPGETIRRSFESTFNKTGTHDLYVHVVLVTSDGDSQRIVQPVTLDVNGEHPQLSLDTESAVSLDSRTMTVNVSNGRDDVVRQLALEVESDDVSVDEDSKIRAQLDSGDETSFSFTASAEEAGTHPVEVTLSYTTADGEPRQLTRLLRADFGPPAQPSEHPQLSVTSESAVENAWRALNVTVSNGMEKQVRQVSLETESDDVTIRENRRVVSSLDAGAERTFSYRASASESGTYPVNLTLVYVDSEGLERQITRTVQADMTPPENPGNVSLTGVSTDRQGNTVTVSGSAANLGGEAVDSVVVSVADAQNVAAVQPQPEYFVGTVESSDFVSFDVNARLSNNRTTVPLEVSYVVDGVTRTRTVMAEAGSAPTRSVESGSGGGGGGSLPFALVGVLVALVLVASVWWARR